MLDLYKKFYVFNKFSAIGKWYWSIFFVLPVLLWACNHSAPAVQAEDDRTKHITQQFTLSSFEKKDKITLVPTSQSGFFSTIAVVDTFLVCADYRMPVVLHVYSANNHALLGQIIKRGDQPGQVLGVANILPTSQQHNCWLYDITSGKFLRIDILKALNDTAYTGEEEIVLTNATKRIKSPCRINDSLFAAGTYSSDDCRFFSFTRESAIISKTGNLPPRHPDWPEENKNSKFNMLAFIYAANMVKHPDKDVFMVAYNKTDRLELYEQGMLKKIVRGPDEFEPVIAFRKQEKEISVSETEKTKYSYTTICATKNFVYTLYSGKDQSATCSNKLLVFDWEGKPIRTIELDRTICFFSIRESDAGPMLYAAEADTGNIYTAKL